MHTCRSEWLNVYADGHASAKDMLKIEAHLSLCDACREELRDITRVKQLMNCLTVIPASKNIRVEATRQAATACNQITPLLGTYLDKEITGAGREAIHLHLALCQVCRKISRQWQTFAIHCRH